MCDMLIEAFEFLNDRQKLDEATPEFCFSMSVSPAMKNPKCSLRCVPRPATTKLNELLLANTGTIPAIRYFICGGSLSFHHSLCRVNNSQVRVYGISIKQ